MNSNQQRYDLIIGMQSKELTDGIRTANGNLSKMQKVIKDTIDVMNTAPPKGIINDKQTKASINELEKLYRLLVKIEATRGSNLSNATPKQRANVNAGLAASTSSISNAAPSAMAKKQQQEQAAALKEQAAAAKQLAKEESALARQQATAAKQREREAAAKIAADQKMQSKAITLRYALYDVGSAAQSASQALLGFANAAIGAAIAQEAAFSQIEKTLVGEVSTQELETLKDELLNLSAQIPLTFDELAKIGMLGSQLGIAAEDIAGFTEVTAKFSAITGMSVDETAMSFGKIANILGLSSKQYEALGSSIAAVGVKTAATEQQIISTAGQIGAVAKAAGFSASQVIGLSASFASLRIAPEEARGVVVRTFSEMSQAALTFNKANGIGGERLKVFANIAKMSSRDFAEGWGSGGSGAFTVFEKFIEGLKDGEIPKELQRIGLDGVRTSKGLTALASGFDDVFGDNGAIAIAREAGVEGTFLDESFGTIVEDLSSKLKMLESSFQNLAAAAGGGELTRVIGVVVDGLIAFNEGLRNLMSVPYIGTIVQLAVGLTGLLGVLAGLVSVLAIATGGALALRTAFVAAEASGGILKGSLVGVIASLLGVEVGSKKAATALELAALSAKRAALAARLLKAAFISTGIGLAIVLFSEIANAIFEMTQKTDDAVVGLDEIQKAEKELMEQTAATTQEMLDFMNQALLPIRNLVSLEDSLYSLGKALADSANDFDIYSEAGRSNINALMATISAITTQAQGDQQIIANNLNALMQQMMASGLGTEAAFNIIRNAIAVTGLEAQATNLNFASLMAGTQAATKNVATSAGRAETALEKMTKAFEKAFEIIDARVGLESALDAFGKSIEENGKSINTFSDNGRSNFSSLRDVIFELKNNLAGSPQSLANALASLREAMIRVGITSSDAFDMVNLAMKATGRSGLATTEVINALVGTITQAGQEAKKLTTITDYVSDLSSVLSDALKNRYARQDARDSISSAWDAIAESARGAAEEIEEAKRAINDMRSTRGVLEYQLKVAIRYGDTLRAEAIRAKISQVDSEMVAKREEVTKAQEAANKTLVGNSKSAIENRAAVRDLVNGYNEYLTSLALSGMSNEELKKEAAKLSDEFLDQGVSLGFAKDELDDYTKAFEKDFTTVINNLPKDITLNIIDDTALQAVVDFVKAANAELAKLLTGTPSISQPTISLPGVSTNTGSGNGGSGGSGGGGSSAASGTSAAASAASAVNTRQTQLDAARAALNAQNAKIQVTQDKLKVLGQQRAATALNKRALIDAQIAGLNGTLATQQAAARPLQQAAQAALQALQTAQAAVPKTTSPKAMAYMASGGYVRGPGTGTSDSINARLSNGEYVLRANAVKYYGTDFMNSLNQMQVQPGVSGGQGNGVVYLSPEDRALLRNAIDRPISLYTENTKIASSANAGNVVLAQRGAK